jgi:hypothetical protein
VFLFTAVSRFISFSKRLKPALGPTQAPFQWIKDSGRDADCSPAHSEVKNAWR